MARAQTFGKDREDALHQAVDALATIIDAYIKDGREIPGPSKGTVRVAVPALIEAKIGLYEAMRAKQMSKAELGRRLNWHPPQVDRLLAMTHGSRLDQLEAAFGALGKRLVVGVEDLAGAPVRRRPGKKSPLARTTHGQPRRQSRHAVFEARPKPERPLSP